MTRTSSALLLCAALTACKHEGGGVSTVGDSGASFKPSKRPVTHESELALHNLEAEIDDAKRRGATGDVVYRNRYPTLVLERAGYLGITEDFDEADESSAKNVALDANNGDVRMTRAHVLAALHRFNDALAEIDAADKRGAKEEDVLHARATIFIATGKCEEAAAIWPAKPNPIDMTIRGALEERRGHPALAEELFERARLEFKDVSPFRISWMDFERARAFEREGDPVRAKAYLEDALEAFPQYAHAAVHVATLETPDRALAYLATVEKRADDPDVLSAHADALRRAGRDAEARNMNDRARARYEDVLAKHPEAYADHAGRFFLGGGGDVKRALELAKAAAARAPSEETLELWLLAARAANDPTEACAAVAAASKVSCTLRGSAAQFDVARKACKP